MVQSTVKCFFPSHQSPLISSPWPNFFSLLFVPFPQQQTLRTGYKLTLFPGNALKYRLPGQILGLGVFMLFCVYLGHLLLLPRSPQALFASISSLRCLLHQAPIPSAQDGVETCEGDTFIAPGQLEFRLQQPYVLTTQPRNHPPPLQQHLKPGVGKI